MGKQAFVPDPRLPLELERLIFEIAAISHPTTIPKLMLLAWRVKIWVEPLLYNIVVMSFAPPREIPCVTAETLRRVFQPKSGQFLQDTVRNIFLNYAAGPSEVEHVLGLCNRVTNLFAQFPTTSHLCTLASLQYLRRLAAGVEAIALHSAISHTAFPSLTHLELLLGSTSPDLGADLAQLPCLTHIAFNSVCAVGDLYSGLESHHQLDSRLQCIAFLFHKLQDREKADCFTCDSRFVCVHQRTDFRQGWLRGAQSGKDYWELADELILARRTGTADGSSYCVS